MSWAAEEMASIDLKDKRLDERAKRLLDNFISQPTVSIPTACRGWDETLAAYRFFDNSKVTAQKVLAPHYAATVKRLAGHQTVLCVQDTTELDYSGQDPRQGLGPLTDEDQCGLYLHPTVAITPDRLCLGIVDTLMWSRDANHYGKRGKRKEKALEEKESRRWIDGYRQVCEMATQVPSTQCVYMADRESDIYELFLEGHTQNHRADWLIRTSHDRALEDDGRISEALAHAPVLGEIVFELPASHKRAGQTITQTLKAAQLILRPPKRAHTSLEATQVTVLLAQETHPLQGETPVTWILSTNLAVTSAEQAVEKIQWYLCRWQIEIYSTSAYSKAAVELKNCN